MESRISATDAARTFSDVLNRVRYRGETFVVERGGEEICRIVPVRPILGHTLGGLVETMKTAPHPGDDYLETVERLYQNQPALPESPWAR